MPPLKSAVSLCTRRGGEGGQASALQGLMRVIEGPYACLIIDTLWYQNLIRSGIRI